MISRRQFLWNALRAGVVTAVGGSLVVKATEQLLANQPVLIAMESTAKGRLDYEALEATYLAVTRGYEEPDFIWINDIETYRRMVRLVQNVNEHPERWHWETASDENSLDKG